MSFACLLGLMIGAAPPAMVPSAGECIEYVPAHPQLPFPLGSTRSLPRSPRPQQEVPPEIRKLLEAMVTMTEEEAAQRLDAEISPSPWLSPRERWCRGMEATNHVSLLDVLTLYADLGNWDPMSCFYYGFTDSIILPPQRRDFVCHPAFVSLLLESLEIRTSDRSPSDKARRLARLVKPWMTWAQIHALFGESKAVIWDHAASRVVYVDYGVSIDSCHRIVYRDDSPQAKEIQWDWVTQPVIRERTTTSKVFNVDFGFMR
jgi:hypothetical protein